MTTEPDDLGDAQSRAANRSFRDRADRAKAGDPVLAYLPRWVPTGNWRISPGNIIVAVIGLGIIGIVAGAGLLGYIK